MLVEGCLGNGKGGSNIAHACVSKALGAEEKKGRVQNKGESIPVEHLEKIFDRFYRESKSRESTGNHYGLGLSIASTIVKKHNGKISVESKNGKNTFTVTLPK